MHYLLNQKAPQPRFLLFFFLYLKLNPICLCVYRQLFLNFFKPDEYIIIIIGKFAYLMFSPEEDFCDATLDDRVNAAT